MADPRFTWRDYEDHIYEKLSQWAGSAARVDFDQRITGKFSQVPRQVDILISGRFANVTDRDITAAVDCKYYTREIDVKQVDEFVGYLEDIQTDLGILITNKGYTKAAERRANRGMELQVIVADVNRIPPSYFSSADEGYYESEYFEVGYAGLGGLMAVVRHIHPDPVALEYSFDPDNPPELLDEVVLSGADDEVSWGDDAARARCVREILRYRNGGEEPSEEDIKRVVFEAAFWWEDGQTWTLWDGQLSELGV